MQPKLKSQTSDLSLEGLEGILEPAKDASTVEQQSTASSGVDSSQDWTLEETARALGLSRGAIIRRLEDGILSGYKLKRSFGWVWRVKPTWLDNANAKAEKKLSEASSDQTITAQENFQPELVGDAAISGKMADSTPTESSPEKKEQGKEYVEVFDVCEESVSVPALPMASYRELIELKTKLQMTEFQYQEAYKKLESANYKIGYLEARLETSQDQLKQIGDSKMNQTWWHRFGQWFCSNQK